MWDHSQRASMPTLTCLTEPVSPTPGIASALVGVAVLSVILACTKSSNSGSDSASNNIPAVVEDTDNPACDSVRNHAPSSAFVIVSLDSTAAAANRLLISVVKDDGSPLTARLLATTGSNVGVSARRLEGGSGLGTRTFRADGGPQELVWNGAPRALDNTITRDADSYAPNPNPNGTSHSCVVRQDVRSASVRRRALRSGWSGIPATQPAARQPDRRAMPCARVSSWRASRSPRASATRSREQRDHRAQRRRGRT